MNILELISSSLTEIDLTEVSLVKSKQCLSFKDLINIYRKDLTITDSFIDCLAICCATHLAVKLESDPIWLYLVGPPSSGKSTICDLLSADSKLTRSLSKFTGIVSGDRKGKHLVPSFQNKCVIIKDGTLLLESNPLQLANVYGELRDIFDGSLEVSYRNGIEASFRNVNFGMIIGITERVYQLNMAGLGERFLHCRLETDRQNEIERNKSVINALLGGIKLNSSEGNENGDARQFPLQKQYTAGFLTHLHNRLTDKDIITPSYTQNDVNYIQSVADVIACSRASVPKTFKGDVIIYNSRPEASTRVAKQLTRMVIALCYVYDVKSITSQIKQNVCKVGKDTSYGRQHDLIKTVALSQNGLNKSALAALTDIPLESCNRKIEEMESLGIFVKHKETNRLMPGRKNHIIMTADWITNSFKTMYNT